MEVAGIGRTGGDVGMIEVAEPRPPADDEVLIEVKAAGVANWDEIVRTGGWDVGRSPPMALGVEAAGTVAAVGGTVTDWEVGDDVMTHPLPLRDQGAWAPMLIAPAVLLAPKPTDVAWEAAAVFPVPALTPSRFSQSRWRSGREIVSWCTARAARPVAWSCAWPRSGERR